MHFPILVISYGNFVENYKLFFYDLHGIGCMPIFTDPTVASLFISSVYQRMGEHLKDRPELTVSVCNNPSHALDMFKNISLFKDVNVVELNPLPLTEQHKEKLERSKVSFKSEKYDIGDIIELLEDNYCSNTE